MNTRDLKKYHSQWRIYGLDVDRFTIDCWRYGVAALGEPSIVSDRIKFEDYEDMQTYLVKHWK